MAVGNNYPFMGIDSRIGIAEQVTISSFVTSTVVMDFTSESMKQNREEIKLDSISGTRDFTKRIIGNESVEGTIEGPLNVDDDGWAYIIKQACGGTVTAATVVAGSVLHIFNMGDMESNKRTTTGTDVKGLSIAVERGDSDKVFNYMGCRVNTLTIKGEIGQPLMISADFIGQTMSVSATLPALTYSNVVPLDFTHVLIQTGDSLGSISQEYFTSFELTINNNLDSEQRVLGDRTVNHLPPTRREINLSVSQRFDTTTAYDRFTQNTFTAFSFTIDSGITITAGGDNYYMLINVPEAYINSNQPEVGDTGPLNVEYECACLYNTTVSYALQLKIRNTAANYY
jgi:hypothetical protein